MTVCDFRNFAPDRRLSRDECLALADHHDLDALMPGKLLGQQATNDLRQCGGRQSERPIIVVREIVARNVPFRDLEVGAVSLEDAFLLIVGTTS